VTAIRLSPDLRHRLDRWAAAQPDSPGRSEAIRRLLEQALGGHRLKQQPSKAAAQKASELAAQAIEKLTPQTQPLEQKQRAKRQLIHGPKEFRDIRSDQPKRK
jgi:predicted transcriptional regulator